MDPRGECFVNGGNTNTMWNLCVCFFPVPINMEGYLISYQTKSSAIHIYLDPPSTWNMGSVIYLSYPHDCWGRPWNYEYLKGLHHEPLLFLTLLRQLEVAATAARPIEKVSARRERMGLVGRGQGMDRPQYSQSVLNKQHEWINCMSVLEFAKIHKKYEHTGFEPG